MPILQQDNGFGDAIGSLLAAYGISQKQKQERQAQQRQQQIDAQNAALAQANLKRAQQDYDIGEQTKAQNTATTEQQTKNQQFESGLKYPANWSKMSAQQQYNYLSVRLTKAQNAGDQQAVTNTLNEMNSLPRAGQEFANTDLTKARTFNERDKERFLMQMLDAKGKQRLQDIMTQARNRVRSGSGGAKLTSQQVEDRATAAALNAMEREGYGAQVREAVDQFNQQSQEYRQSLGPNYTGEPVQQPTFVMPQQPTIIYVPTANGVVPMQVPQPHQQPQPGATPNDGSPHANAWQGFGSPSGGKPQRLEATSHGKPIHSDDGGKTWLPGP